MWCQLDSSNSQYVLKWIVLNDKFRYAKYWLALVVHHENTNKNNRNKEIIILIKGCLKRESWEFL